MTHISNNLKSAVDILLFVAFDLAEYAANIEIQLIEEKKKIMNQYFLYFNEIHNSNLEKEELFDGSVKKNFVLKKMSSHLVYPKNVD